MSCLVVCKFLGKFNINCTSMHAPIHKCNPVPVPVTTDAVRDRKFRRGYIIGYFICTYILVSKLN